MSNCAKCGKDPSKNNRSLPYGSDGVYFCSYFCMINYKPKDKKILVKLLYISDDFNESSWKMYRENLFDGDYFSSEESNTHNFDAELVVSIGEGLIKTKNQKYDFVLVDYGLIGNERKEFRKLINQEIVILTGALDRHYIKYDLENSPYDYPEFDIVSFNSDEIIGDLYHILRKIK